MELLLPQWGDLPELYRNTDSIEATKIVIIDSQINCREKLDTCEKSMKKSHRITDGIFLLLFELVYDFIKEGALSFILGAVFSHFIGKVKECVLLVFVQPLRHRHMDFHIEVPFAGGLQMRHAFAGDAEPGACLGTGWNLEFHFLVQGLHFDGGAKGCYRIGNIDGLVKVVAFPFKVRIVFHVNVDIEVPFRTASPAGLSFAGHPHADAAVGTGRDIDFNGLRRSDSTTAMAFLALVFDNLPCAAALLTGDDIYHLSEGAVSYDTLLTCAVAGRAGIYGGSRFCAAAVAVAAGIVLGDGEFLLHTGKGFPKGNGHIVAEVCPLLGAIVPSAAAAGEHVENVTHIEAAEVEALTVESALAESAEAPGAGAAAGGLLEGIMAELVILGSLVGIGKYMVGFIDLLEFFLCRFGIVLVQIRMVFAGKSSVCFFDFIIGGVFTYAKDVIIILAVCHKEITLFLISYRRH